MAMPPKTALDLDLVEVDELDALNIVVNLAAGSVTKPKEPEAAYTRYPAKLHAKKVAAELGVDDGLIYLPGEPSRTYEDSDMSPPFRQRRYFYYLSGADFADCEVTYEIAKDRLILWIPFVEPKQVLWYGWTPGIDACLKRYQVDEVRYTRELPDFLSLHNHPATTLYLLRSDQAPSCLPGMFYAGIGRFNLDTLKLRPAMDEARVVKTDYEVAMIRRANEVSSEAHRKVAAQLRGFKNEREVEALFQATCTAAGAHKQAYPVIAGSGVNAATLHYDANDAPLEPPSQLMVLDAGCEWNCYASDITRTLPLTGVFSPEASAIYHVVERMQNACINRVRPGILYFELHLLACSIAIEELLHLGILVGDFEEIWNAGTIAAFFPHGLGHHVGLETHDVTGNERLLFETRIQPDVRFGRRLLITPLLLAGSVSAAGPPPYRGRQFLRKNMIVTIEPGIYFCREYLEGYFLGDETHAKFIDAEVLKKYYPVGGVRIEDDILVTDDGYENLTTVPKGTELLRIMNEGRTVVDA